MTVSTLLVYLLRPSSTPGKSLPFPQHSDSPGGSGSPPASNSSVDMDDNDCNDECITSGEAEEDEDEDEDEKWVTASRLEA